MTKILFFMLITATVIASTGKTALTSADVYSRSLGMIQSAEKLLQDGDLVLRNHYEFTSSLIKTFSRHDKSYSHAGIVIIENGYPFVFHITQDDKDPQGGIRKDSLKTFCTPICNGGFGIFRYNINSSEVDSLKSLLKKWINRRIQFDLLFNYQTDDKMYCSEMMAKLINRSTGGRIVIERTQPTKIERFLFANMYHLPNDFGKGETVVAIDNLYLNSNCKQVARFNYE